MFMSRRPFIGLNMSMESGDRCEEIELSVPVSYVDAVVAAGGTPVCIPPVLDLEVVPEMISFLDGMVFIGGDDYWPEHYGGRPQPKEELVMERRDRFDFHLAKYVLEKTSIPVLGICGGHQLLAIVTDGSLIQDIKTEWRPVGVDAPLPHSVGERENGECLDYRHPVNVEKDSLIARILQITSNEEVMVNSTHHQGIHPEKPGRYFCVSAWSPDGIVEAIEPASDSPWKHSGRLVMGVQWHPERMQEEERQRSIFLALIAEARKHHP